MGKPLFPIVQQELLRLLNLGEGKQGGKGKILKKFKKKKKGGKIKIKGVQMGVHKYKEQIKHSQLS